MRQIATRVVYLLPIDSDKKFKKEIDYKTRQIRIGEETRILTIESISFPGRFYVGDGHHTVLAYMEIKTVPIITLLENDEDLREIINQSRRGAINTTHFQTMQRRLHRWHLDAIKEGVKDFYDLQRLIK